MNTPAAQALIRKASPIYLSLVEKESQPASMPTGQMEVSQTSTNHQHVVTRPCAECSEETLYSDLTDDGRGFKLCPKCFVPGDDEEPDPFLRRAYDAINDRWVYE